MNVMVNTDDLRKDARIWRGFADDPFGTTASEVDGFTIDDSAFTEIGVRAGVPAAYETLRQRVKDLTAEGKESFTEMADTLDDAADMYDETDREMHIQFEHVDVDV